MEDLRGFGGGEGSRRAGRALAVLQIPGEILRERALRATARAAGAVGQPSDAGAVLGFQRLDELLRPCRQVSGDALALDAGDGPAHRGIERHVAGVPTVVDGFAGRRSDSGESASMRP